MPGIQTLFQINSKGGAIVYTPNTTVYVNGVPAATSLSLISPHFDCQDNPVHCSALTTGLGGTISRVFIGGLPASVTGDRDTCGDTRVIGSPNVFVGL